MTVFDDNSICLWEMAPDSIRERRVNNNLAFLPAASNDPSRAATDAEKFPSSRPSFGN